MRCEARREAREKNTSNRKLQKFCQRVTACDGVWQRGSVAVFGDGKYLEKVMVKMPHAKAQRRGEKIYE
jgi:hypothetical protein